MKVQHHDVKDTADAAAVASSRSRRRLIRTKDEEGSLMRPRLQEMQASMTEVEKTGAVKDVDDIVAADGGRPQKPLLAGDPSSVEPGKASRRGSLERRREKSSMSRRHLCGGAPRLCEDSLRPLADGDAA